MNRIPASETQCKQSLVRAMQRIGWLMLNTENQKSGGLPDLYFCKDGKSVWVEGKRLKRVVAATYLEGEQRRTLQDQVLRRLNAQGICAVYAVWNIDNKEFAVFKPVSNIGFSIPWNPTSAATYLEDLVMERP